MSPGLGPVAIFPVTDAVGGELIRPICPTCQAISTSDHYDVAPPSQKLLCESLNPWKPQVKTEVGEDPGPWSHPALSPQQGHPAVHPSRYGCYSRPGLAEAGETGEPLVLLTD